MTDCAQVRARPSAYSGMTNVCWLLVVSLFVGCAAEVSVDEAPEFDIDNARLSALHMWEKRIEPLSAECRGIAMASDFVVLDSHALADTCDLVTRGTAQGCVFHQDWKSASIALDVTHGVDFDTVAHELAHVMQWCSTGGTYDVGHTDPRIWKLFGGYNVTVPQELR